MAKILVIDDDRSLRDVVSFILGEAGYEVLTAESGEQGIRLIDAEDPDLILTDMRMRGMDGMAVLRHVQNGVRADMVPVIILTAYGTVEQAVEAMKIGAYSYLLKPFNRDDLTLTIKQALHTKELETDNANLRQLLRQRSSSRTLVYESELMTRLVEQLKHAAATDASILITGESGTGKELVARAVHDLSPRWDKPFVPVNCGAIPANLIESELFGHARGAFTGAHAAALGRIRSADLGTLFLDEIVELPISLQPKLLRVLESKTVDPVGDARSFRTDFRLVCATNRDLREAIRQGELREDLYYRIEIVHIHLPPLRERPEDIPALWRHFSILHGGREVKSSKGLIDRLREREWPGNVRELKNMNQRMIMLCRGDRLTENDLTEALGTMGIPAGDSTDRREGSDDPDRTSGLLPGRLPDEGLPLLDLEKEVICRALAKFGGNKSRAAIYLGIPRHVLVYRIQKYDLANKNK